MAEHSHTHPLPHDLDLTLLIPLGWLPQENLETTQPSCYVQAKNGTKCFDWMALCFIKNTPKKQGPQCFQKLSLTSNNNKR